MASSASVGLGNFFIAVILYESIRKVNEFIRKELENSAGVWYKGGERGPARARSVVLSLRQAACDLAPRAVRNPDSGPGEPRGEINRSATCRADSAAMPAGRERTLPRQPHT